MIRHLALRVSIRLPPNSVNLPFKMEDVLL